MKTSTCIRPGLWPVTALFFIAACGEEAPQSTQVASLNLRGAAIDGSEDPVPEPVPEPEPAEVVSNDAPSGAEPGSEPELAPSQEADLQEADLQETDLQGAGSEEADLQEAGPEEPATAEAASPDEEKPEPRIGTRDEPLDISFLDLGLEGQDVDLMLDYLLHPDEFDAEEVFNFPDSIRALDGQVVSITGYMIPGRLKKGRVRDFMLVRDLMGCCFGGMPNPDEWIDVVMEEDLTAEYYQYMPMLVTGKLTLAGEQDEIGYALGVFKMKAFSVGVVE